MRKYVSISASDQARQHNGDVYNDCTITNVHEAGTVLDAASRCLQSLAFPHMERRGDINAKTETTCDWILRHPQYQDWVENAGLLWIRGRAGSGKSTLMESIVKQNLEDLNHMVSDQGMTSNIFVASFFFHRRGEMLQRAPLGLFRSLLHQILRQDQRLLSEFIKSTEFLLRCDQEGEPGVKWDWTESDLRERLRKCIQKFGQNRAIRLYIDALDESGEASARDLMKYFHQLRSEADLSHLSVCVSCRPYPEVVLDWDYCVVVETCNDQDIATFLDANLTTTTGWTNQALLDDIRSEIGRRASGVFQWAVIVTRRVLSMKGETKEHILADIARTPGELGDLYEAMLGQLSNNDRALAFRILEWITLAVRPLSLEELRNAVAIEPTKEVYLSTQDSTTSTHWCADDEQMCDRMLRVSQGLVTIVETLLGKRVQFDHESVQDYMSDRGLSFLEKEQQSDINTNRCTSGRVHHFLAKACLRRLATIDLAYHEETPRVVAIAMRAPFARYAADYWTAHAEKAEARGASQADLIEFTQWPSNEILARLALVYGKIKDHNITLQHVASRYGLTSVLVALIPMTRTSIIASVIRSSKFSRWKADAIDPKDDYGRTPLSWAAEYGHAAVVRLWLNASAAVGAKDRVGLTPLMWAARNGHEGTVKLLLHAGAAVNVKDNGDRTALLLSLREGHEGTAKLLLAAHKVKVDVPDKDGFTPLTEAAKAGYEAVVELLLATEEVNVNAHDINSDTPLALAVSGGHETVVKQLLASKKVNVEAGYANGKGKAPLARAASLGHEAIVRLLLATGKVNVNLYSSDGKTPLSIAAYLGHENLVQILLDTRKVNVNADDPLSRAAERGHESIVKRLLASDEVKVSRNAILNAAENGHCGIVKLLLSRNGFDVNAKDGEYHQTALIKAAKNGHLQVVKLLLSRNDVDVNAKDWCLETALIKAAKNGHLQVVKLLLSKTSVDVNAKDQWDETALLKAIEKGHFEVVKLLLSTSRVDVNEQDEYGQTALMNAARLGEYQVAKLLLSTKKANLNVRNFQRMNALDLARRKKHWHVVELLEPHFATSD